VTRSAVERSAHFDTAQAARIIGVSPRRVRQCVGAGLVAPDRDPRGRWQFGFVDLVVLRTMRGLVTKGVPMPQVARVLDSLRRQIGARALSRLTIYADGRRVVAWDGRTRWQPDSGQFLFNFEAARVVRNAGKVATLRAGAKRAREKAEPTATAEEWCDLALELERESPEEAHVNLGCLLHAAGEHGAAERHYRRALKYDPAHALAWYDLGVLLEDRDRSGEALPCYERAIAADDELADAHYNLALLYEQGGRKQDAVRHLAIYKRLERQR